MKKLTKIQKILLLEMADFGVELWNVLQLLQDDKKEISQSLLPTARKILNELLDKKIIVLKKIMFNFNNEENCYLPSAESILSYNDAIEFINEEKNWQKISPKGVEYLGYELHPTDFGESIIDEIIG